MQKELETLEALTTLAEDRRDDIQKALDTLNRT